MKQEDVLQKLEAWLSEEGNSKAKIAYLMGYESSQTIDKWIKSGKIPTREINRLNDAMKGSK